MRLSQSSKESLQGTKWAVNKNISIFNKRRYLQTKITKLKYSKRRCIKSGRARHQERKCQNLIKLNFIGSVFYKFKKILCEI